MVSATQCMRCAMVHNMACRGAALLAATMLCSALCIDTDIDTGTYTHTHLAACVEQLL